MKRNSNLDMGGVAKVTNLPTPTAAGDAASKAYVDGLKAGLDWKDSVRAASTANVSVAAAPASIDGVALAAGDRVLLKDQAAGTENGIYTFAAAGGALTRAADADASAEVTPGLSVSVEEGTVNADTIWLLATNGPIVIGTTALSFTTLGSTVSAGAGLTKTGNTIALTVPVTVALGGTGATTAAGARTSLGVPGKFAADFGDNSSTSIAVAHNLGTTDVLVMIFNKATGAEEEADVTVTDANHVTLGFATAPGTAAYRVVVIG